MRVGRLAAALAACALGLSGCFSEHGKWRYEPVSHKGELEDLKPLTVAIRPVKDARQFRSDQTLMVLGLLCPGFPFGIGVVDEGADSQRDREEKYYKEHPEFGHREASIECDYYVELTGESLARELRATGSFAAVDYDPPCLDDYDVILDAKLTSSREEETVLSYGVTVIGALPFWAFGVPYEHKTWHHDVEVAVADAAGALLGTATGAGSDCQLGGAWFLVWNLRSCWPRCGSKAMSVANHQLAEAIIPKLRETVGADPKATETARKARFADALDPELRKFREAIASRTTSPELRRSLLRHEQVKVGLLEALRVLERELSTKEQELRESTVEQQCDLITEATNAKIRAGNAKQWSSFAAGLTMAAVTIGGMQSQMAANAAAGKGYALSSTQVLNTQMALIHATIDHEREQQAAAEAMKEMSAKISEEMKREFGELLKPFLEITGSRKEIRAKWLAKYREVTPTLDEVKQGKWPRATPR